MKNQTLITIIVAIVMAAAGFFAGIKYQQSKQPSFSGQFNFRGQGQNLRNGSRQFMGPTNRMGFRPVNGEIIAVDDQSITVKLQDGSSKIVFLTDQTQINKAEKGSKEDLKKGETIVAFGQENSDGSINANNIQLNPQFNRIANPPAATN